MSINSIINAKRRDYPYNRAKGDSFITGAYLFLFTLLYEWRKMIGIRSMNIISHEKPNTKRSVTIRRRRQIMKNKLNKKELTN